MRLGAYSGTEGREPGSKTCRNQEIAIPAKGINDFTKSKRQALTPGPTGMSQKPNLAEILKSICQHKTLTTSEKVSA